MSQMKSNFRPFTPTLLATLIVGAGIGLAARHALAIEPGADWVKGRILVLPRAGLAPTELDNVLKQHGARARHKIRSSNIEVVEVPASTSEVAVVQALKKHRHIKFAELDYLLHPTVTANDPYTGNEWHLAKMQVPTAWNYSLGTGITVAVLDTGVDATHPDLAGQLVAGWNLYDNNANTADVYGHGTMVAGVIGAASNNALGVSSIAWLAKIMPVRISAPDGMASISTIADGLIWAADHGARVANVSYAVSGYATVINAAQYMKSKGGITVVSAGNSGTLDSSSASDAMISVAATDSNDLRASWSTYGPFVDVSAPGVGIWTTTSGGGYSAVSGTSFSSPATAATITLMMAANPALSTTDLTSLLKSTAVDLGAAGWDQYYGSGRVDTGAAVLAAVMAQPGDTTPPSVAIVAPGNNATVSGIVPVDIAASDNVGVTRVDLLVNGTTVASDTTSPFAFSWDSRTLPDGNAKLMAYAYDAAGNYTGSTTLYVTIKNNVDSTPPVVTIKNPVNGGTVVGNVSISALSTDNVAVAKSSLYIDGKLVATASGGSLAYNWNTRKAAPGMHTLSVKATDTSGNSASSTIQVWHG